MNRALKISSWLAMTLLAALIAIFSLRYFLFDIEAVAPAMAERFIGYITPLLFHAGGGIIALALGPWGFWTKFRNNNIRLHRLVGRIYLSSMLVSGTAGFYLAFSALGALPGRIGFGLLAVLWLTTGTMAYRRIRQGNVQKHREWMIRNYALTFSAVTLRLWLPLLLAFGYDFPESYPTVAWLAWVPNLLVAEWVIGKAFVINKQKLIATF